MKETPLVSIIIPTYNRAHLIGETLDSVLAQTYTNWECIVVDDGSTDATDKLLAEYSKKDARFQYHHRPKNRLKGGNAARNYGFELSKGEYINWFDSDDLMVNEKLDIQLKGLHNSSYDYAICQTMMYDVAKNKEIGLRAPKLYSGNIFQDYVLFKIFWLTGAPVWRKSFLMDNHLLFNETLHQSQDYDFHMRALGKSENYSVNEKPLVIFKQHKDNMSNSITDSANKIISNIKVKINLMNNFKLKLKKEVKINLYKELFELFKNHTRNKQFYYSKILLKCMVKNIDVLSYNWMEKIYFIGRLNLACLSYLLFSKGYRILKFDI